MIRSSSLILSLTIALFSLACHPDRILRGSVTTIPQPEADIRGNIYDSGSPVVGAEFTYICPDDEYHEPRVLAESDAQGTVYFVDMWTWQMPCSFQVTHEDYYPQEFLVEDLCLMSYDGGCRRISLQAELVPRQIVR